MSSLNDRLEHVRSRIADAARRAGRDPDEITLVAVTKTIPIETIRLALDAGVTHLGENRVQEAETKIDALPGAAAWHLIGHLQSNKAKRAVERFDWIHSIDDARLLERIDRLARELGRTPRAFIQVNTSGAANQSGVPPTGVTPILETASDCTAVRVEGFMTIAPLTDDDAAIRASFRQLRELAERLSVYESSSVRLRHLSMGMTHDFETAIEEGATFVRIGSAIFGPRS